MSRDRKREERERQREQGPGEALHPDATDPREDEPHHALANPAADPDPTEFPDPYERRPDPRGPDEHPGESEADEKGRKDPVRGTPRAPSTSEPHPPRNYDDIKPVKGDR
jgi:hypothetical protein